MLSETDFNKLDIRTLFYLSKEQLDTVTNNILSNEFLEAQNNYGVNVLFLHALSYLESDNGTSRLALLKNNLFGYGAVDNNPFDSATHFSSKDECIDVVARSLSKNYLNSKGKYFNGYTLKDINVLYASDTEWSSKLANIMHESILKIKENEHVNSTKSYKADNKE